MQSTNLCVNVNYSGMAGSISKSKEPKSNLSELAGRVRAFNRFYTQHLGILQRGILGTRFSLSEARVLYEVAQSDGITATQVAEKTGLDEAYLSRALSAFEREGLLRRKPSSRDGRERSLHLTSLGRNEFAAVDNQAQRQIEDILRPLSPAQRVRAVDAMCTIQELISGRSIEAGNTTRRRHGSTRRGDD